MKKRAFVRYSKQGKVVPGSLILTSGSYPNGPSTWKEVPADLCCENDPCLPQDYSPFKVITGGVAGDGVVLVNPNPDPEDCPTYTIVGPNDYNESGWVYLTRYYATETCLAIEYQWASFDDDTVYDRPVYWTSAVQPTGIPGNTTSRVEDTPASGIWNITVPAGQWFSVGVYTTDSCCGRGLLQVEICEVECPEPTTTTSTSSTSTTTAAPTTTTSTTEVPITTTTTIPLTFYNAGYTGTQSAVCAGTGEFNIPFGIVGNPCTDGYLIFDEGFSWADYGVTNGATLYVNIGGPNLLSMICTYPSDVLFLENPCSWSCA